METKTHYIYTLKCRDGTLYTGYTNDLTRRMKAHQCGKAAKYTRGRTPVQLVYARAYDTKSEALKAEHKFKKLTRQKKEIVIKERAFDPVDFLS
jgi:putative endonuclease